jgi:hypothetical protein
VPSLPRFSLDWVCLVNTLAFAPPGFLPSGPHGPSGCLCTTYGALWTSQSGEPERGRAKRVRERPCGTPRPANRQAPDNRTRKNDADRCGDERAGDANRNRMTSLEGSDLCAPELGLCRSSVGRCYHCLCRSYDRGNRRAADGR